MSENSQRTIVIDTNVFMHILNEPHDERCHIEQLLFFLHKKGFTLCVDDQGKIGNEYHKHLTPIIKKADETSLVRMLIAHWMRPEARQTVPIDLAGELLVRIRTVIPPQTNKHDAFFVASAASTPCNLVSNDGGHILTNKASLRKKTRRWHGGKMRILSSLEAAQQLVT